VFARLYKLVESSDKDTDLPSEVDLGMPLNVAWEIWTAFKAGKGRFLPYDGCLMDQPDGVMSAIYKLDSFLDRVQQQYLEKKHGQPREDTQHPA
jgi:hypothetical protein